MLTYVLSTLFNNLYKRFFLKKYKSNTDQSHKYTFFMQKVSLLIG